MSKVAVRTKRRWPVALVLLVVGAGAAGVAVSVVGVTQDSRRSGAYVQPERTQAPIGAAQIEARAAWTRDALEFPVGTHRTTRQVHGEAKRGDFTEVDELDSEGRVLSLTEFDANGNLQTAVRFDARPNPPVQVNEKAGVKSAGAAAATLGIEAGPATRAYADDSTGGWKVHWDRAEKGVPVRGDGTLVRVGPDGCVLSVSHMTHVLAAAPSRVLDRSQAAQLVNEYLTQLVVSSQRSDYLVQPPRLEWISPNGAFDPTKPLDGEPVYRLAWVVDVRTAGATSGYLALVTMYSMPGTGGSSEAT